jgi:NodT family efflux transporter outer membrane factor (OMF) lipoprotein
MTSPKRMASLACLSILLAGCSLTPSYIRPDPGLAAQWMRGRDMPLEQAVPVQSGWWRSFDDPVLSSLVERSLRDNLTLAGAQARIEQARGTAEAAGAALYPTLSLNGAINRTHPGGGSGSSSNSGSPTSGQSLFAQAGYEIDFWGKNRAARNSAQALTQATVFDGDTVALTLTASVADTYFQLLSLHERLALAQKISADADRLLKLVQTQVAAGVATELQVELQRNSAATFAAVIPVLQQQSEQNAHLLAVLVGATPENFTLPAAGLNAIRIPQVRPDLPASILQRRPDIRAAEARLISANFDVGAARAAFFPSLSLTGSAGYSSDTLAHFFGNPFTDIAASLLQPVFDGGQLQGRLKYDRARFTELAAAYRLTILGALQDVEDSLSTAQHQQELETSDLIAVSSARRAAFLAETQYRLGTADFLSVLTAQRTLFQAEDALLQVHLQRLQASVGLFRALGGGFGVSDSSGAPTISVSQSAVSDPISGAHK